MPTDPETNAALHEIKASVDELRTTVTQTNLSVAELTATLREHAAMELEKFRRIDSDRRELKDDLKGDIESVKKSLHARVDRVDKKAGRPIKIAGGIGTGVGAAIVGAAVALWEWLKNGGHG